MAFGLDDKTTKYVGYGLLAGGIALGGYAIYSHSKKKSAKGLGGVRRKTKRRKKGGKKRRNVVKF